MFIHAIWNVFNRFLLNLSSFLLLMLVVYACYYYRPGLNEYRFNNSFFNSLTILVGSQLKSIAGELAPKEKQSVRRDSPALNGKGILIDPTTLKVEQYPLPLSDELFQAGIRLWDAGNSVTKAKIQSVGSSGLLRLSKVMPDSLLNRTLEFNISPVNYDRVSKELVSSCKKSAVLVSGTLVLVFLFALLFVWLDQQYPYDRKLGFIIRTLNLFSGVHLIVWSVIVVVLTKHFINFSPWMIVILAYGSGMFSDFFNSLKEAFNRFAEQDYLLAVKARGGSLVKNFYKEILIIFTTLITAKLPAIISGTIIVEYSFSYEGLGLKILNGINHPEANAVNVILGVTILVGTVVIITNSLNQFVQQMLDPRLSRK